MFIVLDAYLLFSNGHVDCCIIVSRNIGNLNEVLGEHNGWDFEPGNLEEIKKVIESVLNLSRRNLRNKGMESRKQYIKYFDTETCVQNYAKQLLEII